MNRNDIPLGNTCYAVGLTILVVAVTQMLTTVWLPLFGSMAVMGAGFAAEGAVNHGKPTTAMMLILGGAVTPLVLMGGALWFQQSLPLWPALSGW